MSACHAEILPAWLASAPDPVPWAPSDDPGTGAVGDATSISVTRDANGLAVVPALDGVGLGILAALVAIGGVLLLRRRLA